MKIVKRDIIICKCGHSADNHADVRGRSHCSSTEKTGACDCVHSKESAALPENSLAYADALAGLDTEYQSWFVARHTNNFRVSKEFEQRIVGCVLADERGKAGVGQLDVAERVYGTEHVSQVSRVENGQRPLTVIHFVRYCNAISDDGFGEAARIAWRIQNAIAMAECAWFISRHGESTTELLFGRRAGVGAT